MKTQKRTKYGGRTKGTPNKVTGELRERIKAFLDDNWDTIKDDFKKIDARDRVAFFEKFLPYIIPKQKEVDVTTNGKDVNGVQLLFGNTPLSDKDIAEIKAIQEGEAFDTEDFI